MSTQPTTCLQIDQLILSGRGRQPLPPVSWELAAGKIGAVLGWPGSGKTRLARVLAGRDRPVAGSARMGGISVGGEDLPNLVWLEDGENCCNEPASDAFQTLADAGLNPLDLALLLESLRLTSFNGCPVVELPTMLRHRLALAHALIPLIAGSSRPPCHLLMLDDLPGLDERSAAALAEWLPDRVHAGEVSLLFTTRSPQTALLLADRVLVLRAGLPAAAWPEGNHASGGDQAQQWRIRLEGRLEEERAAWFPGMRMSVLGTDTLLIGSLPDGAAQHGLLDRVRDLGLQIISMERENPTPEMELIELMGEE